MRLAGQVKFGFYPLPSYTTQQVARRLTCVNPMETTILDPCCGTGEALQDIASAIGVPGRGIYAIELHEGRGEAARGLLDRASHLLAPCGDENALITYNQFSLIYLNPPYDEQFNGGGRDEMNFLNRAVHRLMIGGILVFVAPLPLFVGNRGFVEKLDVNFEDTELYTFPDAERKYREAIFFGRRRPACTFASEASSDCRDRYGMYRYDKPIDVIDLDRTWEVRPGKHPKNFVKVSFTRDELIAAMQGSPLNQLFSPPEEIPLARPPMKPGPGHRSLLVVCGLMNGVIKRDGEEPFVLRGTVDKEQYVADMKYNEDGSSTKKVSENTVNFVRCLGRDGTIKTFTNANVRKEEV